MLTLMIVAALSVLAFLAVFHFLAVIPKAQDAIAVSRNTAGLMRDATLDDDAKEAAVQKASLNLMKAFVGLLLRGGGAVLAAFVPLQLADWAGIVPLDASLDFMLRLDVILVTSVLIVALAFLGRRLGQGKTEAGALNAYSGLDQRVHKVAFGSRALQLSMADMEDSMFAREVAGIDTSHPIFITSLPRAGTTILLTAMAHVPGLATHLYRDMPFVMAPQLWARLSKSFRKDATLSERAHGDGIKVGYDSPEAFEEVVWKAFWPDHYTDDRITLWGADDRDEEGEGFLRRHMAKIIALRCGEDKESGRYISKNNGNVARIPLLRAMFPEAAIVVPVRDPLTHAKSLLRQHRNFMARHAEDPFVKRYMADIGHFEFGELHRPIDFPGPEGIEPLSDPDALDYWLAYWIAAFEYLETLDAGVIFVSHEALCNRTAAVMDDLFSRVGIDPGPARDSVLAEFRPIPEGEIDAAPSDLLVRARAVYDRLTRKVP